MTRPVVLIHGAWHGAWAFDPVTRGLESRGLQVHAVDMPLTGVADDIAAARACIESAPGAVVLGHSYGGLLITHAALGLDVSHLVYLAAMMPGRGEDVMATITGLPATPLSAAMRRREDGLSEIDPERTVDVFYGDCDPEDARAAAARLRPMRMDAFPVLDVDPAWASVPSTYVVCRDDQALHPDLQRLFGARASRCVEWEGAHSPFLAQPERVVELLTELAG
jgi:pimeloyl-ACP methyl ester carboxylesterase